MNETKVIGYCAQKSKFELFCDSDALIVTGSEDTLKIAMKLRGISDIASHSIRKVRFGDILEAMRLGASYAFDEESYSRFAPIGKEYGIPIQCFDFTPSEEGRIKFLILDPQIQN